MWCILAFWTFFVKNFFFYDSYFMTKIMIFTFNLVLKKLSNPLQLTKKCILFLEHLYVWNHEKVDVLLCTFAANSWKLMNIFVKNEKKSFFRNIKKGIINLILNRINLWRCFFDLWNPLDLSKEFQSFGNIARGTFKFEIVDKLPLPILYSMYIIFWPFSVPQSSFRSNPTSPVNF